MFSYKDSDKLKKDCEIALNNAGHRTKKRKLKSKRKQRSDKKEWQNIREVKSNKTYEIWLYENRRINEEGFADISEPLEANPDQLGYWEE